MKFTKTSAIPVLVFIAILILSLSACQVQTSTSPTLPPPSSPPGATAANSPTTPATTPSPIAGKVITAFAGSSSKAALDIAGKNFESETGIKVNLTYGGSGTLLSQMKLTRTGDLFIPASPDYILKAIKDSVILPETETRIYYLVPAILVQEGNPQNITSLGDLAQPGIRIAIADPRTVPAGLYAYEILDYNKALSSVGVNIVTYGESNDKISSYVILKSVDAAIAWDNVGLQQPDKLDAVYLEPDQVPRLSYMSGAVSTYAKDKESAQKFLQYLSSTAGQQIFAQYRYYTTESAARKHAPNAQIGGIYTLPADYTPLVK